MRQQRLEYIQQRLDAGDPMDYDQAKALARQFAVSVGMIWDDLRTIRGTNRRILMGRITTENHRAGKFGAAGKLTLEGWQSLCEQYSNCCALCGAAAPLVIDHIIPLSRGGLNAIENIQPLCSPCNRAKSDSIP